ncbi:MAG: CHAD domain-containing protein [Pseudomonadota bacterium]|nr:CHAD domain-containing protein [Pseudomonadota bacterium]
MDENTLVERLCQQAIRINAQALADLQHQPLAANAVHDCRVAVKRLRAQWQLLRPWLSRDDHRAFDHGIRSAARLLAGARDNHVMAATLQKLASKADKPRRHSLSRVASTLFSDTDLQPETHHHQEAITAFAQDQQYWQSLALSISDHELLVSGLARTYKQCRNRTIKAQGGSDPQPWHDLRKWVKYLLYQQQALADQDIHSPCHDADLERLGKKLGKLHDLHMLREHVLAHSHAIEKQKDLAHTLDAIHGRENVC